jgi:hypothetical protein
MSVRYGQYLAAYPAQGVFLEAVRCHVTPLPLIVGLYGDCAATDFLESGL